VTPEGIRLLAEVAVLSADRTDEESLPAPEDVAGGVTLFVLTSAARLPEAIALPTHLPVHWPATRYEQRPDARGDRRPHVDAADRLLAL